MASDDTKTFSEAEIIAGSAYKTDSIQRLYLVAAALEFKRRLDARSKADEIIQSDRRRLNKRV